MFLGGPLGFGGLAEFRWLPEEAAVETKGLVISVIISETI